MDLLKRWKSAATVDNGLMLGVILISILAFTWSRFIDWNGPVDDLSKEDRSAMESCIMAERSLGDSLYQQRPDCRKFLGERPMAARVPAPAECVPRINAKIGGDDGLDTCGYPGFPKCRDSLPSGCP